MRPPQAETWHCELAIQVVGQVEELVVHRPEIQEVLVPQAEV